MRKENPFDPGYYTSEELKEFGFKAVGSNVMVAKDATIVGLENISIGSHVRIDGSATILAGKAGVNIGHYVHIGAFVYLGGRFGIDVGDFNGLSQGVRVYSVTDDYDGGCFTNPTVPEEYTNIQTGRVVMKEHVLIGSGSVILPDVTLETGVSVGALSLVIKNLREWTFYMGAPARLIKPREVIDPDGDVTTKLMAEV